MPNSTGAASACGDPLANFCCTDAQVFAEFPTLASQLQTNFATYESQGEKLYNCSIANGKYTFLFFIGNTTGYHMGSVYITAATATNAASPASCVKQTSATLGISAQATSTPGTSPGLAIPTLGNTVTK